MQNADHQAYIAALQWHIDQGVDEVMELEPVTNRLEQVSFVEEQSAERPPKERPILQNAATEPQAANISAGAGKLIEQAKELVTQANTLEELAEAIQSFEGLDIKKTATNFVFSDGHASAKVMLVGEAPGADEDRMGKPFVGVSGQLLDKILACIGLDRTSEDPDTGIYISNILNWRPPGNRTPTPQEMDISLPFIEKHIVLADPDILILSGGVAAKTVLHSSESISKMRGQKHVFAPQTLSIQKQIPVVATYHPSYLLRTPSQKSKVWQDMLFFQTVRSSL